jgi:D-arabinonate dehydratase/D-galactarolactone cycloisomerase
MLAGTLEKPIEFGIGPFPTFSATLVRVTTDDRLTGIGECIVRKAPQVTKTIVEDMLAPIVVGRDPYDVEAIWTRCSSSFAGGVTTADSYSRR